MTTFILGAMKKAILESEFSGNLVEVCPTGVFYRQAFFKAI